jgi:hypothetical protein
LMFVISGGTVGATQGAALDDATNLMNNAQHVLMNNAQKSGVWNGGHFGWGVGDDDNPERFGEVILDPGTDVTTAHFKLLWTCEVRINTDSL